MQIKKIVRYVENVPTKGRYKGKVTTLRVVTWERDGKEYKTRKEAMAH